ncbi:hypothetical protein [Acetobacter conturbans]|nr:hypothetical protein [Acetobacter conturbans]
MIRTMMRKLTLITAGLSAVVAVAAVTPAHAERIISDSEASRLTLESLTAVPAYHPPVRHYAMARKHVVLASRAHAGTQPSIHLVSFHMVKKAGHAVHTRRRT